MSTSKTKRARKPRAYHHGNLRPELIAAALELVREGGPHAVTLRDVAKRAGVSHAAPYRHFADKEALLGAVAGEGFRALTEALRASGEGVTDPVARLRRQAAAYVHFGAENPAHYAVMFGRNAVEHPEQHHDPELWSAGRAAFGLLMDALQACRDAGLLREESIEALALCTWAQVHGLTMLLIGGGLAGPLGYAPSAEEMIEMVMKVSWEGLKKARSR